MPSNIETTANPTQEGDTSVLSVATDASTATKPKANGKAGKEDQEFVGIDVCDCAFVDYSSFLS